MLGSIGIGEILVILLIFLLLFGSKELPEMAKKLGKGVREFNKLSQNAKEEVRKILEESEEKDSKRLKG